MKLQNQLLRASLVVCLACLFSSLVEAGGLVRVSDGKEQFEGKVLSMTGGKCSLMDRQGRIVHLQVAKLKTFDKVSARFQPHSSSTLRQELISEFPGYEVVGSTRYLVCAKKGRGAAYAKLFDSVYRDVEQFFRVRGFRVTKPETPLIAVVFGSQKEFAQYCVKDKVPPAPTLMGYYSLLSNRVALFDDGRSVAATNVQSPELPELDSKYQSIAAAAGIAGETANTIVHETTHQVGYNIGIHSRLGSTPTWLLEGLATALEPQGMRKSSGRKLLSDRLNPERLSWFSKTHLRRRPQNNLSKLVASDQHFQRHLLDSYSEAWAFTFFLLENPARRTKLVKYLQLLSKRDPQQTYTAKQRLKDFQKHFGDISRLEVDFLRFMDRM